MSAAIALSILFPLLIVYAIWLLDLYSLNRLRLVTLAIIWGAVAFGGSLLIQSGLVRGGWLNYTQVVQWIAPLTEEVLKGAFILVIAHRTRLYSISEGITYGFAAGIGFGMTENLFYISTNPEHPLLIAAARVVSSTLMHAAAAGALGAAASGSRIQAEARLRQISLGLLTAVGLHLCYNHIALVVSGLPLIPVGAAIGVCGLAVIWQRIRLDLRVQAHDMQELFQNHLPTGEVGALLNPEVVVAKLRTQGGAFSNRRVQVIEQYVKLYTRRAMLERHRLPGVAGHHSTNLENQLNQIDQSLNVLQHEMGIYSRLWLRSVLPGSESGLWQALGQPAELDETTSGLMQRLSASEATIAVDELAKRVALLQQGLLFSQLEKADLRDLSLLMEHRDFEMGDLILKAADQHDKLYLIDSGTVIASIAHSRGSTVVFTYTAGDCFNEHGLITGTTGLEQIEAASSGQLYSLRREDFVSLVYGRPHIGINMMHGLVGQVKQRTALIQWVQETGTPPLALVS